MNSIAFIIRCSSSVLNCCIVFLQVVLDDKLRQMAKNRFLICFLLSLYKGILADKNALITFSTNLVLLFLKNVCQMCRINSSDLRSDAFSFWAYFDDLQQEIVCCEKRYRFMNCNIISCWDFSEFFRKVLNHGLNFRYFGSF